MPKVSFDSLAVVLAVAFLIPLFLGFAPRVRVPSVVIEIVAGIIVGPQVLGWAKVDEPVQILAVVGLAFLLFLAGLEIDTSQLKGRLLKVAGIKTFKPHDTINAATKAQILAITGTTTLNQAFARTQDGQIDVVRLSNTFDSKAYTMVRYGDIDDQAVEMFFRGSSTTEVARTDYESGNVTGCSVFWKTDI